MTMTHSTVVSNFYASGINNDGQALIQNSIVAENDFGDCLGSGTLTDGGYNLFATGGGCPTSSGTSQTIAPVNVSNTVLAALGNHGGNTQTMPLQVGSPAIDAIPQSVSGCGTTITTDQRGLPRPVFGSCDIGRR